MKDINLDFKFTFDYTLTTEERFSLRKWLEKFVYALNYGNLDEVADFLDVGFGNVGLTEYSKLGKQEFVNFVVENRIPSGFLWYRFSEIKTKKKNGIFLLNGSMEVLNEKMLLLEGEMVGEVLFFENDSCFRLLNLELSPRLRVRF